MKIGVPKEIKNHEYRIGLVPAAVRELVNNGHSVFVQRDGGAAIGFSNDHYSSAGAEIIASSEEIFATADMIVKVKEPQPEECKMLREDQLLFTYLHLAPDPAQTRLLVESGATCIAYETVTDDAGALPLLAPMSEIAGRLSIQAGAQHLEMAQGGSGVLLGGVPGVAPAKVTIIGGGIVGDNAATIAVGMGANVTILDRSLSVLRQLDDDYRGRVNCVYSTAMAVEDHALESDIVVGAVLVPGAEAPKLLSRDVISRMKRGSVVVDVAIDQGGCFETSKPTTHQNPTYVVDGVVHYCVANMPGAVARTSTLALNNATWPFALALANKGAVNAMREDPHLLNGLNVCRGLVTYEAVADALGYDYTPAGHALTN
ncbi:MAG: alanine dehydrogenase [Gammaproteobacteria bacterium]|jgi:alanine dehydrogenase|nr:alanine dehydrogenase [Gammaproteobacteria bacterium]MDH4126475.1 alanine dehydrogenase [Gammaproteobacteria bacterium]MDH5322947.1 alanine dehydrogenase [Gammaproteobacteria bacterium]